MSVRRDEKHVAPELSAAEYRPGLHRFAVLTAATTFPLVFVGGMVTSYDVGMAVPDWPTTFGYNMFTYPWFEGAWGVFVEHSHRLLGSLVGLLTVVLAVWLWIVDSRPWMRWLGVLAVVAVIGQGVLGGLRVLLIERGLAMVHGCVAQAFFALMASLAVFTSATWRASGGVTRCGDAGKLQRLAITMSVFVYSQVVLGALVRHTGRGLEAHLLVALLVIVHVGLVAARVFRRHGEQRELVGPARMLVALTAMQVLLGFGAWVMLPELGPAVTQAASTADALVATAHAAVGALLVAMSVSLALRSMRHVVATVPGRNGCPVESKELQVGTMEVAT